MRQHTVAGERIIASSDALADVIAHCATHFGSWDEVATDGIAGENIRRALASSRSATRITR